MQRRVAASKTTILLADRLTYRDENRKNQLVRAAASVEIAIPRVEVFRNPDSLARAAAEVVLGTALTAVSAHGGFKLCLAGGQTPRPVYALLGRDEYVRRMPWGQIELFFGDERCVPPSDGASNYRMLQDALLSVAPLPSAQVHRIAGELPPARAAADYEDLLRERLGVTLAGAPAQGFDLALLGMGSDGHTASLFPGSVDDPARWAAARQDPEGALWRVSLLPAVFEAARAVLFLVSGAHKAARLAEVLRGPLVPQKLPAQRIRPRTGTLTWLVDLDAAAALLSASPAQRAVDRFTLEVHA